MKTDIFQLLCLAALLVTAGCGQSDTNKKPKDTVTSGTIEISCDESFAPIIDQEINVFESTYPNASILPHYVSEVEALNLLLQDSVRLAVATRELTPEEVKALNAKKLFPKSTKIATDGIAFIVNKKNPNRVVSVDDLRKVVTGEVTRWDQLFPGSKLGGLQLVFDNQNSSTVRFAIDSLCQGKPLYNGLKAMKSNEAVIDFVSQSPDAIGVIGASWIGNKNDSTNTSFTDRVEVMAVRKHAGFEAFRPYQYYLATGEYPLTRSVYIIITDPRSGLPSGFTRFVASYKGQLIILKTGIVPSQANILLRDVSVTNDF